MTLVPPAPIPPYNGPLFPYTNITPFTYRDGLTYLEVLEGLRQYINTTVVDFINNNFGEMSDAVQAQINALIETVNNTLTDQTEYVEQELQELKDYVDEQVAIIIGGGAELNDATMFSVLNDQATQSRQLIDTLDSNVLEAAGNAAEIYADAGDLVVHDYATSIATTKAGTAETNANTHSDTALAAYTNALPRTLKSFGAVGDGVANDRAAIIAAINSGFPLDWGNYTYKISGAYVVATLTADAVWHSNGATIIVDAANAAIQYALYVNTVGFNVLVRGPLTIDGNMKAFTGIRFNHAIATYANITLEHLRVRNCYRLNQTMVGGDGIFITGAWANVTLIRPDVRQIVMAAGAGVAGSQGVSGITINSFAPGQTPQEITILHPYINGIYCEDSAYLSDQDAIRIFTENDIAGTVTLFDTHFSIIGGAIVNSHGRSIKSQCEFGYVSGLKILRNRNIAAMAIPGGAPEIDFQVGGGIVENVEIRYESAVPYRVLNWSGTRLSGGKYSTGFQVRGLKVSMTGGANVPLNAFMNISTFEAARTQITLTDIEVINKGQDMGCNFINVNGTLTTSEMYIRLTNIFANLGVSAPSPAVGYLVYRTGTILVPIFLSSFNIVNTRVPGSALFSGADVAGSITAVSAGQNIRIA